MGDEGYLSLADTVRLALCQSGAESIGSPKLLVGYTLDYMDPQSPELRVLVHSCDAALLAPFVEQMSSGDCDLRKAARDARVYLTNMRMVDERAAQLVVDGIAEGVARNRGEDRGEICWVGECRHEVNSAMRVNGPRLMASSFLASGQVVKWDCVWFGFYPQTEITPSDSAYADMQAANWNANGDARVGDVWYRRITRPDAINDGCWPTDAPIYRYFRYEPIKWRVLEASGDTALILADMALDCRQYNARWEEVTWETSSIRLWLNECGAAATRTSSRSADRSFVDVAFPTSELDAVLQSAVANDDNAAYGTEGGNGTSDRVFLLSEAEVYGPTAISHGFAEDMDVKDEARRCSSTDYAQAMGAWVAGDGDYKGSCWWWLRSPGGNANYAAYVNYGGWVHRYGYDVDHGGGSAVRPATNVNLSSPAISYAGTVSSDGVVDEVAPNGPVV